MTIDVSLLIENVRNLCAGRRFYLFYLLIPVALFDIGSIRGRTSQLVCHMVRDKDLPGMVFI